MNLTNNSLEESIKRNQKNAIIRSRRADTQINNYKPETLDVRLTSGNRQMAVNLFLNLRERNRRLNAKRRNRKVVDSKKKKRTEAFNMIFLHRLEMLKKGSPEYKQLLASRELDFALYLRNNNAEECLTRKQQRLLRKEENTNTVQYSLLQKCNNFQQKFELSQRHKGLNINKFYWETKEGIRDAKETMCFQGGKMIDEKLFYKNRDTDGKIEEMENLYYETKIDQAMEILPETAYVEDAPSEKLKTTMKTLRTAKYKEQFTTEMKQLVFMVLYNVESEMEVLEFNLLTESSFELPDKHVCYNCKDGTCVCTLPYRYKRTLLATPTTVQEIYGSEKSDEEAENEMEIEEDDGKISAVEEAPKLVDYNDFSDEEEFDAGF